MKVRLAKKITAMCLALGMTLTPIGQAFANEETQTTEATSFVEWIDETEVETELEPVTEPEVITEPETETSENEIFESEIPSTEVSETQEMEETETETQEVETEVTIEEETTEAETEEVIECEENAFFEEIFNGNFLSQEEQERVQEKLSQIERPENYLEGNCNSKLECISYLRGQMSLRYNYVTVRWYSNVYLSIDSLKTIALDIYDKAYEYTGVSYEGDAIQFDLEGMNGNVALHELGNDKYFYEFTYKIAYKSNTQQEQELRTAVQNKTTELCKGVSSEYEKIRKIYDFICSTVSFDYANMNDDSNLLKYTAYAALINHTAVCQGYATLFYRMCLEAGISARTISGTGNGGRHSWNIVRIGNVYYNVDSTWDRYASPINRNYRYFLKANAEFKGHERDAEFNTASFNATYSMTQKSYSVPKEHQVFIGLYCTNGTWYYYEEGKVKKDFTDLVLYNGTWYYVQKGVLKWGYSGLTKYYGTWYYVEKGVLNWGYTGLTNFQGTWYYVENGVLNWDYTGFTDYYGTRYYVENSVMSWNYTTFDMQRASAISDRFTISPVNVGRILVMYGHKYSSSLNLWEWDGESTTWIFEKIDGNSNRKMKVDLTTGIGKLYYKEIYYGSVNLVTKQVVDGSSIKRFFSNYVPDNGWVTRAFTWKECGGTSVRIGGVESLGKTDVQHIFGCKNSVAVKHIGTNAKNRPIFKVTDEYGNPLGYVVADSTYNYFDVYDMHCVHIGASSVMS